MGYFNNKNANNHPNSSQRHPSNYQGYQKPYTNNHSKRTVSSSQIKDYGPYPFVVDIEKITKANSSFRRALWTGDHLQLTLMSLLPGEDIGLEIHDDVDQFIRIEEGKGMLMMGDNKDTPDFQQTVSNDYAFIIPAGKWHNLINIGAEPLKLYSIYAPKQHPAGTIQATKQ